MFAVVIALMVAACDFRAPVSTVDGQSGLPDWETCDWAIRAGKLMASRHTSGSSSRHAAGGVSEHATSAAHRHYDPVEE